MPEQKKGILNKISNYCSNLFRNIEFENKTEIHKSSQIKCDLISCQEEQSRRIIQSKLKQYFSVRENLDKYINMIYYKDYEKMLFKDGMLYDDANGNRHIIKQAYKILCFANQIIELSDDCNENISDNTWSYLMLWRNRNGIINYQKAAKFATLY